MHGRREGSGRRACGRRKGWKERADFSGRFIGDPNQLVSRGGEPVPDNFLWLLFIIYFTSFVGNQSSYFKPNHAFPNPDQLIFVPKPKHSISTALCLERSNKINLNVPKVATKKWNPTAVCATGSSLADPLFIHLEQCVVGHDGFVFPA